MGRLEDKVVLITGAARGVGRATAVRFAEEGADVIAVDLAKPVATVDYALSTADDLTETARLVEHAGRRVSVHRADVRDHDGLTAVVDAGASELGRIDAVSAGAGILNYGRAEELTPETWHAMIDISLTGVWHTAKAAIPHLRAAGGGSISIISSAAGLRGYRNLAHYVSAKHGVVGLMRALAVELGPDWIRVNSIHPTSVDTPMVQNPEIFAALAPQLKPEERTRESMSERYLAMNALPVPWIDAVDVANAVVFLASEEARYITGVPLPVDAGATTK